MTYKSVSGHTPCASFHNCLVFTTSNLENNNSPIPINLGMIKLCEQLWKLQYLWAQIPKMTLQDFVSYQFGDYQNAQLWQEVPPHHEREICTEPPYYWTERNLLGRINPKPLNSSTLWKC